MTMERAIEVFVHGFSFTRSFTHPYLAERLEGIWAMRDIDRTSRYYRKDEFVAYRVAAEEVDRTARAHTRGRFAVCMIRGETDTDIDIRKGFKGLGYRLMATEPFFVHSLGDIRTVEEPLSVVRVTTKEAADRLSRAARTRQILPVHLAAEHPPLRQYMVSDGDVPIAWVRSIEAAGATWCSNMFVEPAYRRRGIARAMLTRMLQDDREAGSSANVLLASHTGAKLYPVLGYERIGELLMFTPPRG